MPSPHPQDREFDSNGSLRFANAAQKNGSPRHDRQGPAADRPMRRRAGGRFGKVKGGCKPIAAATGGCRLLCEWEAFRLSSWHARESSQET
eukprot:CAMPEP_0195023170 /NCGR_PEP_ID=MMETSP0326_2-20130528/42261_1 /TAXON_ID=2866 ORGANISM="Crypthecodinium cohnii, Strain Seligo" /NCGR_SAMPLE_ID=MMETSP0326_2 /ASSEMBLY_ACC=CAM_ASM_000348 /LENGTH=90 /DNA_ID=CAMNT_0040043339 /DNA_START=157 /DNA_END=426 /DNA_ORIENTATION=+